MRGGNLKVAYENENSHKATNAMSCQLKQTNARKPKKKKKIVTIVTIQFNRAENTKKRIRKDRRTRSYTWT